MPKLECDRVWEIKGPDGEWVPISYVSDTVIVLATGQGVNWRDPKAGGFMPSDTVELRYSIPLQEPYYGTWQLMPWRPGHMPLLLLDAGLPDVMTAVREAQARRRG